MAISVDYKELAKTIATQLNLEELKGSLTALKGIDWNPFDEDGDQYVGVFGEMQHNWDLLFDVAVKAAHLAERTVVGVASLDNPQKHKVVVQVLDDLVRAPWYIEPFDGLIFDGLVTAAVKFAKVINWGVELPEVIPAETPKPFEEIGG